ncbi:MAG: hypothetical protein ACRDDH_05880, partial [Cetobacterium sp.]|uniref:hypothetical protein n=1 Tax=Cetobacterium sp. TaxID=2071632 RepID=UPI003EE4EEB5
MERLGFQEIKTINYYNHRDDICSKVYYNEILDTIVILDFNITEIDNSGVFSYREYTNLQNQFMKKHKFLYRFCNENFNRENLCNILEKTLEI